MRLFKSYIIVLIISLICYGIVSIFIKDENIKQVIICSAIILFVIITGFFSLRKSINKILKIYEMKALKLYEDIPQDLVINGIRFHMTVRSITWLKIVFWSIFYLFLIFFTIEIIILQ